MNTILNVKNLSFEPDNKSIIKDATFDIYEDELIRIEGPSGSGKSTLLKLIASLLPKDSGEIFLQGQSIDEIHYQDYRKNVSYVAQNPHLFGKTVRDNFDLVFEAHEASFDESLITDYMNQLGLSHISLDQSIHKVSGGERQRIGLIRNLIFPPKILLLDEVTSSLDAENRKQVWTQILAYKEKHPLTILWVTHIDEYSVEPHRVFHIEDANLTATKGDLYVK